MKSILTKIGGLSRNLDQFGWNDHGQNMLDSVLIEISLIGPDRKSAEFRWDGHDQNLAELVPIGIGRIRLSRHCLKISGIQLGQPQMVDTVPIENEFGRVNPRQKLVECSRVRND